MPELPVRLVSALADRYRLERELGQGGMATVYLAEDLKHDRRVAIKVLKPELAAMVGGDRFVSEIKTTANLQHPHILPLFDSGEADGFLFYVMPYVEGETLRDRIDRDGQLPTDEALALATKVGGALSAAHAQGIVHRDIKPANILLANGEPLVADFGIALAVDAGGGQRLTETGLSLGTPYYMSPEQATGEANVGPAADQYALAAVLYEMLVGDPPFVGGNAQAVLGKIIQGAPTRPREVRRAIPRNVDGAVLRGLERLPADRFASVGDFVAALTTPSFRYGEDNTAGVQRSSRALVLGLAATTLLFAGIAGWALTADRADTGVTMEYIGFGEGAGPVQNEPDGRNALSPDGSLLVYVGPPAPGASSRARSQLWRREFGQLEATPIPGTEGAMDPAFSPDGDRLAFVVLGRGIRELRAGPLDGGPFQLLTDSVVDAGGVSWGNDGYIYYDANLPGDGLARIAEVPGRPPEAFTTPRGSEGWHAQPHVLPDDAGVLFYAAGVDSLGVADLSTGEHRFLVEGVAGLYSASGHLVWVQADGTMLAQPFDPSTLELTGSARPLADEVAVGPFGGWNATIADEGDFLYTVGVRDRSLTRLGRVDPDGAVVPIDERWQRNFGSLDVAPNSELAVDITDFNGREQVWVRDGDRGPPRQLTSEGLNTFPKWAPDGERLLYFASNDSVLDLVVRDPDTPGRGRVLLPAALSLAGDGRNALGGSRTLGFDVAPAGDWLVVADREVPYAYRLDRDLRPIGERVPLDLPPPARAGQPRMMYPEISPDGRWIAYFIDDAGYPTLTVRPFPNVSDGAWSPEVTGVLPRWSSSGDYLYFIDPLRIEIVRVPVSDEGVFAAGEPELVAQLNGFRGQQRFSIGVNDEVFIREGTDVPDRTVRVEGFFEELERLFAGGAGR